MSKRIYIRSLNNATGVKTDETMEGNKIIVGLKSLEIKNGREVVHTINFKNVRIRNAKNNKYISVEAFNKLQNNIPILYISHDDKLVDINFHL